MIKIIIFLSLSIVFLIVALLLRKNQKLGDHSNAEQCLIQNISKNNPAQFNPGDTCFLFENGTCYKGVVNNNLQCVKKYQGEIIFSYILSIILFIITIVFIFIRSK